MGFFSSVLGLIKEDLEGVLFDIQLLRHAHTLRKPTGGGSAANIKQVFGAAQSTFTDAQAHSPIMPCPFTSKTSVNPEVSGRASSATDSAVLPGSQSLVQSQNKIKSDSELAAAVAGFSEGGQAGGGLGEEVLEYASDVRNLFSGLVAYLSGAGSSHETTHLGGYSFTAIGQRNPANYTPGSKIDKAKACMATCFTMVARALGDTNSIGGPANVDQFWSDGAANFRGYTINGHKIAYSYYNGKLYRSDYSLTTGKPKYLVSPHVPRLNQTDPNGDFAAFDALASGKPLLIGGSIKSAGGAETHWMLGVGTREAYEMPQKLERKLAIVANDPWTGTKVLIDPATGNVLEIMNPADGEYYPIDSATAKKLDPKGALGTFRGTGAVAIVIK